MSQRFHSGGLPVTLRSGHECDMHPATALLLWLTGDVITIRVDALPDVEQPAWTRLLDHLNERLRDPPGWLTPVPEAAEQAVLRYLEKHGSGSADDVFTTIMATLPPGTHTSMVGKVFATLARKHRIVRVGETASKRPIQHGARLGVWTLKREAANAFE